MRLLLIKLLFGLLAISALAGCAQIHTTQAGVVGINRSQSMMLSSQEVEQASAKSYAQQVNKASNEGELNADPAMAKRVRTISNRLIAQVGIFRPDAASWKWEVNVMQNEETNAYAMAGGKIMVYSGLITKLQLTDAELAAVIGHEISHALREHSRESMSRAYAQQMGLSIVGALAGLNKAQTDLASLATDITLSKPNSRTMESEADLMGLELMARAGYDPRAAVNVWNKMIAAGNKGGLEFLSTHPSGDTRIQELQKSIPQVLPLYEVAKKS
ncbi:M48 family metallopeptidase [Neisseriaceae bacterium TC5R-5]|nr:M48 family metallopeptidase [Neisseriaceae bacterium TC5R-5]